jgi:hypothetical protein
MKNHLSFLIGLGFSICINAQETNCKVTIPEISESYSGQCKNGLAHGYGIAKGIDQYEGQFKKGLPDGKGTYTWASGKYYEGGWQKGIKVGQGKLVDKDSVITGYWKDNKYIGKELIPPYKITRSTSVSRATITKSSSNQENELRVRILQGGIDSRNVVNLSVISTTGSNYSTGHSGGFGIKNIYYPVDVKIKYSTWNKVQTVQYEVFFEFTINEPGSWEVVLNN